MLPYQLNDFGNPHSRTHAYGWETEKAVEKARAQVAELVGADPREIIFTSGATEANNIAIKGVAHFYKSSGKNHVITVQTVRISEIHMRRRDSIIIHSGLRSTSACWTRADTSRTRALTSPTYLCRRMGLSI